jgi:class 3 adenylate cyclase/tetratricopeptide (TPR) repeat protein
MVAELGPDISTWLRKLGLEQYEQAFVSNAIEPSLLPHLTSEDLKDLGVTLVGHRRKLLDAIAVLRETQTHASGNRGEDLKPTTAPEAERRQVTILFADLVGFTALGNRLDAEVIHGLLQRYFEKVDSIIEEHGGRIDKHIGDCAMAVFGAPVAHGNDAERAIRAALSIKTAVPQIMTEDGTPLAVHIGVAGGQVVASRTGSSSHSEYTVTGETVNLASRLTAAASAGEILISDDVQRPLADQLACTKARSLTIKGFANPVPAWLLVDLRQAGSSRPFVGRRSELRLFQAAIETCLDTGRGQTLYVRGEAGLGKTSLVETVLAMARQAGFACHMGHVLDFGGKGRDAIRALARSLVGLAATSDKAPGSAASAAVTECERVLPSDAPLLYDLLDLPLPSELKVLYEAMDSRTRSERRQETLARLIERASRRQPRVLAVEDIHWAEPTILADLAKLVTTVAQIPALLIMTSRSDRDPLDGEWRSRAAAAPLMTIDLAPLPPDDARAVAAAFLVEDIDLVKHCLERAAGNPLFLEQLLRHATESKELGVPASIQSLVQARLDRLNREEKRAVQAAAVIGQRFDRAVVAYLVEGSNDFCDQLVAHQFIRRQPDSDVFMFSHALIREATYETLLRGQRHQLHRRAAEWYLDRDPMLRAAHLDRARDPQAAGAYLIAARSQAAAYRPDSALSLVKRGIELVGDGAGRFELTHLKGEILHDVGDMSGAQDAYETSLQMAGDDRERCLAWMGLAAVRRVTDNLDGALADLQRAEAAATQLNLHAELARIHVLRGNLCFPRGDLDGCLREHNTALEIARNAGAADLEAMALGGLGDAEYVRGHMLSAHRRFRECVDICEQHGFGRIAVANRPMLGFTRWLAGDARGALSDIEAAISAAHTVGHRRAEMIGHHAACACQHALLRFDAALEHAEAALTLSQQLSARRFDAEALAYRADLYRLAGRHAEAIADAQEAVRVCRETGAAFLGPFALGILALATDDPKTRLKALQEADELLRAGAVGHNYLLFRRDAIEACLAMADWDGAERFAADLADLPEPTPFTTFYVARGRALASHGRGHCHATLAQELQRLREEGEQMGLLIALPAIEKAMADLQRRTTAN